MACGEYGLSKIELMVKSMENGNCVQWLADASKVLSLEELRAINPLTKSAKESGQLEATSSWNQLTILMHRGYVKGKRDSTLTHLR